MFHVKPLFPDDIGPPPRPRTVSRRVGFSLSKIDDVKEPRPDERQIDAADEIESSSSLIVGR